jgi:hypothetical protein
MYKPIPADHRCSLHQRFTIELVESQTVFSIFQQFVLVMRGREKLEFECEETFFAVDLSQCWDAPKDLKMP